MKLKIGCLYHCLKNLYRGVRMAKEEELMRFFHEKVFDPIIDSKEVPVNI